MTHRRTTAAILAVLAVTTATLTTPVTPAVAAPAAPASPADSGAEQENVIAFPRGADIVFAGPSGFLTRAYSATSHHEYRWTRFSDGVSTLVASYGRATGITGTDRVFVDYGGGAVLKDMATGADVLTVTERELPYNAWPVGAVESAVFAAYRHSEGETLSLIRMVDGAPKRNVVKGLPTDATGYLIGLGATTDTAKVTYTTGTKRQQAVVDLATATVTTIHDLPTSTAIVDDSAESPTHRAWTERPATSSDTTVVVEELQSGATQRFPLTDGYRTVVGLAGNWVTYAHKGGNSAYGTDPLHALTARSLETGATRKLLDHVSSEVMAPDGTQLVRGGTVAQGEGLYRIAPGADGAPVATLIASTGEPTHVALVGHTIPSGIDADRNSGQVNLDWQLSRVNVDMTVTLRHPRTGWTHTAYLRPSQDPLAASRIARWEWSAEFNGDYTWEITAKPLNGIGPDLRASGAFKVVRKTAPHDFNDNGSPDILTRDGAGRLWRIDTRYPHGGTHMGGERTPLGGGWQIYDRIEATGNLGGSAVGDFVARDKAGALWLYKGRGDGTFTSRAQIGTGWNTYDQIAGGSDLTGDSQADLVATDKTGALWLYPGTGKDTAPFAARKRIGTGWGVYNQLSATGNIAGGAAGDLVARDKAGVLWLYTGKGDGTFAARTKIGTGWNTYSRLVGTGDANKDGRPDLLAYNTESSYLYKGTGDWRTPFRARELAGLYLGNDPFNEVA
ncbi:FG-GAP repeat domain-containing protein [Streptomyces sp. NPDC015346]|uniref:FG-GAP repeat domain-containing protein n=1 Tax=Streptomyces sp. NPDC015346 TaxID=3364954 RepID=UPI0037011E60